MQAHDVMTTEVETVTPDDEVSEVLTRMARADFDGFPVVDENGTVVGIVTQTDLVDLFQPSDRVVWIPVGLPPFTETVTYPVDFSWNDLDVGIDLAKAAGRPISEVMTSDVVTVRPTDDLDHLLNLLSDEERDINRVPVVEDDGRLAGIVARQDLLRALRTERRRSERP